MVVKEISEKELLEKQLTEVDEQLSSLSNRRGDILDKLRAIESQKVKETNSLLDIKEGAFVVAVTKSLDYHCSLLQCYKVCGIHNNCVYHNAFKCVEYTYRTDDGDLSFRANKTFSGESLFSNLVDNFNVYRVDEDTFYWLLRELTELSVNEKNIFDYENKIYKGSFRSIGHR